MVEESQWKNNFEATRKNIYRNFYDVCRHLVNLYFCNKGEAILRKAKYANETCTITKYLFLVTRRSILFCVNDDKTTTKKGLSKLKIWLEKKFNKKSVFEL